MNGNAYEQFLAVLREKPDPAFTKQGCSARFRNVSPTGSEPAACR
jgi:hypothetical protein